MGVMHPLRKTWLAVALGVVVAASAARAQVPENIPRASVDDDWDYTNPGPAKCVEIGNFYLHKGNLKGALSRFEEAAKTNSHYAPAYLGLGKVYEKMGQKEKALESYQRYLDELPSAKDAEEARAAQRAVARLEKEVGPHKPPASTSPPR
jgi:tetratricopeptide (TPR) repeat protein